MNGTHGDFQMPKDKKCKRRVLSAAVDRRTHNRITTLAGIERRNFSEQVRVLLDYALPYLEKSK